MFAVAFPLAPLMAYVNNYFEYTIDLQNLMSVSDQHILYYYVLSAWTAIFGPLYMLCSTTSAVKAVVSSHFGQRV
jgi:hypothetical protein